MEYRTEPPRVQQIPHSKRPSRMPIALRRAVQREAGDN
jgi:hypothetical protein